MSEKKKYVYGGIAGLIGTIAGVLLYAKKAKAELPPPEQPPEQPPTPPPPEGYNITLNVDKKLVMCGRDRYTLYGRITKNGRGFATRLSLYTKAPWTDGFEFDKHISTDENGEFRMRTLAYLPKGVPSATLYFKVVYVKDTERYESNVVSVLIGKVVKITLSADKTVVKYGEPYTLTAKIYYPFKGVAIDFYVSDKYEGPYYRLPTKYTDENGEATLKTYGFSTKYYFAERSTGYVEEQIRSNIVKVEVVK